MIEKYGSDDIKDLVADFGKWIGEVKAALDKAGDELEAVESELDEIRMHVSEKWEGEVMKCSEMVHKVKALVEDI